MPSRRSLCRRSPSSRWALACAASPETAANCSERPSTNSRSTRWVPRWLGGALTIQRKPYDRGGSIGVVDVLIAGSAAERDDETVLARNVDEFERVDGIDVGVYRTSRRYQYR